MNGVCVLGRANHQGEFDEHVARHRQHGHWRNNQRKTHREAHTTRARRHTPQSPLLTAQSRPTAPASPSSPQTPVCAAPGPAHHGGSLYLLTWCPDSVPPSSACARLAPPWLPGLLVPPTLPTWSKFFQPHHSSPLLHVSPFPWPLTITLEFPAPRLPEQPPTPTPASQPLSGLHPATFLHLCPLAPPTPAAPALQVQASNRERDSFFLP